MSLPVFPFCSGRGGFLWPGLNSPVLKDGALQRITQRGNAEQQEMQAELGTETQCTDVPTKSFWTCRHTDEHKDDCTCTALPPHLHL